ncbi:MAG: hypothetical protein JW882_09660 [Deltaproteobacteria bacterium]|nr:hypothetical protein [Deltaproteobacteria bacterium]
MEEIILWEVEKERILACELAISEALKELGLKKTVIISAEPPLISRNVDRERLPVLEIRGQQWSLRPGQSFTKTQLVSLFRKIFIDI